MDITADGLKRKLIQCKNTGYFHKVTLSDLVDMLWTIISAEIQIKCINDLMCAYDESKFYHKLRSELINSKAQYNNFRERILLTPPVPEDSITLRSDLKGVVHAFDHNDRPLCGLNVILPENGDSSEKLTCDMCLTRIAQIKEQWK